MSDTVCPRIYFTPSKDLPKPTVASLQPPEKFSVGIDMPSVSGNIESTPPEIPQYSVPTNIEIPDYTALSKSVSVHTSENVSIPSYAPDNTPQTPDDPSPPPSISPAPEFDIPVSDIAIDYESIITQLNIDVPAPDPIDVSTPDPPTITISEPSDIPLIPLVEATILMSDLEIGDIETILGRPKVAHYQLFSIVDEGAYNKAKQNRNKLIAFLDDLLSSIGVDTSKLVSYYDSLLSLFNKAYQKIVSLRNKGNELDYWANHLRLQADTFARQYRMAVDTYKARMQVFRSEIQQIKTYYDSLREAYNLSFSIYNSYFDMVKSTISDANRLMGRVSNLNNDIASAYRLHIELAMRLLRRDALEAELYRLQAEKAVQLYRLLELESVGELADAQREALTARYNAVVNYFNAVRKESKVLSDIAETNQAKLDALQSRLEGEVKRLEGLAERLSAYAYTEDRMYANQLIRLMGLYRDKVNTFIRRLREYHNLITREYITNKTAEAENQLTATSVQTEIDTTHSELQADINRAYLHEQGIITSASIMSDARIASTIIESFQ